jgi:hypothetical protein
MKIWDETYTIYKAKMWSILERTITVVISVFYSTTLILVNIVGHIHNEESTPKIVGIILWVHTI